MPVWKLHVPPVPQSAIAKHCLPGVGPPAQTPPPLYSHTGSGPAEPGRLNTERSGTQPPSLLSKLQGTLSPALGPLAEARIPRSSRAFGIVSSPLSSSPLSFRSSPRVLVTLPDAVPTTNIDENVTSSSGSKIPVNWS